MCLIVSLSACMSVCLFLWLPVFLSVYLYVCLSAGLSLCPYKCLSVCLSAGLSICISVCLPVCLSLRLYICLTLCLYLCVPVYLSLCMPLCLSVCLLVFLPAYPFHLSVLYSYQFLSSKKYLDNSNSFYPLSLLLPSLLCATLILQLTHATPFGPPWGTLFPVCKPERELEFIVSSLILEPESKVRSSIAQYAERSREEVTAQCSLLTVHTCWGATLLAARLSLVGSLSWPSGAAKLLF